MERAAPNRVQHEYGYFQHGFYGQAQRIMQTPRPDLFTYPPHGYSAEKARQGEIILRKPWMRAVFIGGLVGVAILGFALSLTT